MESFIYRYKSKTVFYNGYVFDSLLELQYALMIENTHAWIRDGLEIYFDLDSLTSGIKGDLHCYRPDFLIRDWATSEAQLVEIKPDGYDTDSIEKRKRIANHHIEEFDYDWRFKIVFESDIILTDRQWRRYEKILAIQHHWRHKPCLELLQNNSSFSDSDYYRYVHTGLLPSLVP